MRKTFVYVIVIGILIGAGILASNSEKVKSFVISLNAECDSYRNHHKSVDGWYYSVESISSEPTTGKTFIIGRNMQPKVSTSKDGVVSISLEPNDRLREIEVPKKTAGLKSVGAYFTVKTVDGTPTLIYFPSDREVITHMLNARGSDTSPPVAIAVKGK